MSKATPAKIAEKVIVQKKLDPRTVSISDFSKYQSYEMSKFAASLRTYKKSLIYIGGTLALSAFAAWLGNKVAH
jgi:inorganic pyrophosphatase